MKLECDVIRDLLPLYAEKLASPASSALVEQHDKWTVDKNCSYWSIHLWNAVVDEEAALKIRGFVCTPEKIEQAFSAFDCVEVDKDFSRAGDIYCYKDGERTELQLCS